MIATVMTCTKTAALMITVNNGEICHCRKMITDTCLSDFTELRKVHLKISTRLTPGTIRRVEESEA